MAKDKSERLFDKRVVERNIARGVITRQDYEAYLAGLDDGAERAQVIEAEYVEGVLDGEDEKAAQA